LTKAWPVLLLVFTVGAENDQLVGWGDRVLGAVQQRVVLRLPSDRRFRNAFDGREVEHGRVTGLNLQRVRRALLERHHIWNKNYQIIYRKQSSVVLSQESNLLHKFWDRTEKKWKFIITCVLLLRVLNLTYYKVECLD